MCGERWVNPIPDEAATNWGICFESKHTKVIACKSHSLKRSITTHAAEMGAMDTEITEQFRRTNDRTMRGYVDTSELNHKLKL